MIHDFLTALTLLTTLSVPSAWLSSSRALGKSLAWFPLVGLLLGGVLAMALFLFRDLFSVLLASALVTALWAFLTGALHLEGLADSGDGLPATVPRERRLEIMHDPRVGAFGVVILVTVLLLKFAAVASLRDVAFLIVAPTCARWAMVFAAAFPLARTTGMAALFREGFGRGQLLVATVWAVLIAGTFGWRGLGAFVGTVLVVLLIARLALNRLGGLNGDVYGAMGEVVEATIVVIGTISI